MGSNTHIPLNDDQIKLLKYIREYVDEKSVNIVFDYSYSDYDIILMIDNILKRGYYKTKERALLNFIRDEYLNYKI
jgi:hypothetical protein